MQSEVSGYIQLAQNKGASDVAVYFRDLKNGPWFGLNAKKAFLPASLLKVPLMMSAYHEGEINPDFLKRKVVFEGPSLNKEYFKAPQELQNNKEYTIDEVVDDMIKYSDNNASHVLSYALDSSHLLESYTYLGIEVPSQANYEISTVDYASFFRILYNSTFLDPEQSEKALALLTQTSFNQGIVAGVPSDIKVAHKFGERQLDDGVKQLHDCGIVYNNERPYLLCIMTRGNDFTELAKAVSDISSIVYKNEVSAQ